MAKTGQRGRVKGQKSFRATKNSVVESHDWPKPERT